MSFITELQEATARVVEKAGPAVVRIGRGWGRGGGLIIAEGLVLTNAHNLRDLTTTVTFADGRTAQGTVTGHDRDGDIAVLAVDTTGATPITWDLGPEATTPVPGTPVFAVAVPAGGGVRVTFGTVSGTARSFRGPRGRLIRDGLEHTAPLGRGSSGSPVLDAEGRLLGINVHRLGDGFYLALAADADFKARIDALARGESPSRPHIGISIAPPMAARRLRAAVGLPEHDGVLVRGVEDGSAASRTGIKRGDLIIEAGGRAVKTADDLFDALGGLAEGDALIVRILRGVEEVTIAMSFTADPDPAAPSDTPDQPESPTDAS